MLRSWLGWPIAVTTLVAALVSGSQGGVPETARLDQLLHDVRLLTDTRTEPLPEEPVFDFSFPKELVEESQEQLVVGTVLVYGEIPLTSMKVVSDIVLATIAKTCGWALEDEVKLPRIFSGQLLQDVQTYGKRRIGMIINFWLLPLKGGVTHCAEALAYASLGKPEGPYVEEPKPPFRELLEWEMAMSKTTSNWGTGGWYIELDRPSCSTALVIKAVNHPHIPEENKTENNTCKNYSGEDWHVEDDDSFNYTSQMNTCGRATSPCVCAALTDCTWVRKTSVDWRCERKIGAKVSCKACNHQGRCPKNYTQICALEALPCTCANSYAGCHWDEADEHCYKNQLENETTTCWACPHQAVCDKPRKKKVFPEHTRTLPAKFCNKSKYQSDCPGNCEWVENPSLDHGGQCEDNSQIRVIFDRTVRLQLFGPNFRFIHGAITLVCRRDARISPSIYHIDRDKLAFANKDGNLSGTPSMGNVLQVDVNGIIHPGTSDCDLLISDYAVEDLRGVQYAGMIAFEYTFAFADTAPPRLVSMSPDSGSIGIAVDSKLVFDFDENVKPGPHPHATMVSLGGVGQTLNRPADKIVAEIDLTTRGASISNSRVIIDLSGRVDYNTLYTVELHSGAVRDTLLNVFEGLPRMEYTFQTRERIWNEKRTETEEGVPTWLVYVLVTLAVGSVLCCVFLYIWYRIYSLRRRHNYAARDLENNEAAKTVKKAWDGSYIQSYTMTEGGGDIGDADSTWARGSINKSSSATGFQPQVLNNVDGERTGSKTSTGMSNDALHTIGRPLDARHNKILQAPNSTNLVGRSTSKQSVGRQNSKPEINSGGRSASKQSAGRQNSNPEGRQDSKPDTNPGGRSASKQSVGRQNSHCEGRQNSKPDTNSGGRSASKQSVGRQNSNPERRQNPKPEAMGG